jgi:hypothetical protein
MLMHRRSSTERIILGSQLYFQNEELVYRLIAKKICPLKMSSQDQRVIIWLCTNGNEVPLGLVALPPSVNINFVTVA